MAYEHFGLLNHTDVHTVIPLGRHQRTGNGEYEEDINSATTPEHQQCAVCRVRPGMQDPDLEKLTF